MALWRKLGALWRLSRPGNLALIFVAVFVGAILAVPLGDSPFGGLKDVYWKVLAAAAALSLVAAGGYALNDRCDLAIDRVNRPHRPLPAGDISVSSATAFALLCWAAALGLALISHPGGLWILGSCVLLSLLYAVKLKTTGLPGNLVVALMTSVALLYGAYSAGGLYLVLPIAVPAFLLNLARELFKDVEDLPGDQEAGARTLAVRLGARRVCAAASLVLFAVPPLITAGYLLGAYIRLDALLLIIALTPSLIVIGVLGLRPHDAGRTQRRLKILMPVILGALLLGRLFSLLTG